MNFTIGVYYILGIIIGILASFVYSKLRHGKASEGEIKFDIYNENCPVEVHFNRDLGYMIQRKQITLKVTDCSNYKPYNDKIDI